MHKDQLYGGIIFIVAIVLIIFYNLWLFGILPQPAFNPIYAVYIPVWLLVMLVLGIAGWIGWTMASTPPPKPIEELTAPMATETPATMKSDEKPTDTKKT
jgi:predicted DNA-binding transcriptional regulator